MDNLSSLSSLQLADLMFGLEVHGQTDFDWDLFDRYHSELGQRSDIPSFAMGWFVED